MDFRGNYAFLSNMNDSTINIPINGRLYSFRNAESAFQAHKCPERAIEFLNLSGPQARELGRKVQLRSDWEQIKLSVMEYVIKNKYIQNPDLYYKLSCIQERIVENSKYNNTYWGVNPQGVGQNHLGNILTKFIDTYCRAPKMCFTGRRPKDLYGYDHDKYIPLINKLKEDILSFYNKGYRIFVTGGAQGFDQLAFWAVNALKRDGYTDIKNIVYVPFLGQENAWKETGLFSQQEYRLMLSLADEVYYLRIVDPTRKNEVVSALYSRNHTMVDTTNTVFGLYPDYSWQLYENKGGTAECLRYANSKGKQIFQLSHKTMLSQFIPRSGN